MKSSRCCRRGSQRNLASASSTTAWSFTESRSIANADGVRPNARAILRIAGLVLLFAVLAPVHLVTKLLFRRSPWPRRFLAAAARIIGARVRCDGRRIHSHTLLVSNHVSWLDILVLGGSVNCTFVSKDELGHPFFHWLADQSASVSEN